MAGGKIQAGQNGATPGENVEATADANETLAQAGNTPSPAQQPSKGPPPIPWHILFPPGHPMHGAGRG